MLVGDYALAREGCGLKARWPGLAAAYVGAVVGAGFAGGREIAYFFTAHGTWGLGGAALAGVLFGWAGASALRLATIGGHRHYGAVLRDICGPWLGPALDRLGFVFIFVGLVAVVAGAGALGHLLVRWPPWVGMVTLGGGLCLSLTQGRRAHVAINLAVVPVILITCLVAGAAALRAPVGAGPVAGTTFPWPISAILYVAYNMVMAVAGMCAAIDGEQTVRDATYAGWTGGLVLGLLCLGVTLALLPQRHTLAAADLPLAVALPEGFWRAVGYPAALFAALWTTGSAAALALGTRLCPARPQRSAAAFAAGAVPLALFGLSPIVTVVYPLMGYGGIPLLVALIAGGLYNRRGPRESGAGHGWQRPRRPIP